MYNFVPDSPFWNWTVISLSVIIGLLSSVYLYFKFVLYGYWKRRGIFYVEPIVPIGNLRATIMKEKNIGDSYADEYLKHKHLPMFGMYTFHKPSLVIADPDLIRIVLTKEFSSFHDRGVYCNPELDPLSGNLFMLSGQSWKNLRSKLTPTFTSGQMKRMFDVINNRGEKLPTLFEQTAGEDLDLRDAFSRFTTDVIITTAMGIECNSLENPDSEFRYFGPKVFEPRPIRNAFLVFAPKILDLLKIPFTPKDVQTFFLQIFESTVKYRLENNVKQRDFMDLLMQLMNKGTVEKPEQENESVQHIEKNAEGKISLKEAAAQAYVFFIAGFETSATLSADCLYELTLNQELQHKCREDIKAGLAKHGGMITYDSLNDMPYLHKVIQEGLRKYPSLGALLRVCTKEIILPNGFKIEKGIDIIVPLLGIQRDPDIYPEPKKFDPERFNSENIAKRHPYTYLPFGEGPRSCIGMRFALMQTKIGMINSLLKYQFVPCERTPKRLKIHPGSLVAIPDSPIYVRVKPL